MTMGCKCLLCGSHDVSFLEQLNTADILRCNAPEMMKAAADVLLQYKSFIFCHCRECDLRFFWPPVTGSREYYDVLQRLSWYYLEDKPEYHVAKKWISTTDHVLEIGCGSGVFSKHVGAARYTGLEFSTEAVQCASERGLHIENTSIERHALEHAASYDVVCAFQVLEHVATVHGFIAASVRSLKPGGLLIYCVPSEDSYLALALNSGLNLPPHHVTRWTDSTLRNMQRLFSLTLVSLEHEVLADFHKRDYASLLALRTLSAIIGHKQKSVLLDLSRSYRLMKSAAWRIGKVIEKGLDDRAMLPWGHSVTAVFQKTDVSVLSNGFGAAPVESLT